MCSRGFASILAVLGSVSAWCQGGIGDPTFPLLGNAGYEAKHYDLKLVYSPMSGALQADVTMSAVALADEDAIYLDFSGFTIDSVSVDGTAAMYSRTGAKLKVQPKKAIHKGDVFSVRTVYSGIPDATQSGALPAGIKSGWIRYPSGAVAVCEPELAHTWFPCNDHPRDKATFGIDISVPPGYTAVGNGVGQKLSETHYKFTLDKPGSTCMVLVAVGKFGMLKQVGPGGLPMVSYLPLKEESSFAPALAANPDLLKFLSDRLGTYPYSSYGVLVLPAAIDGVNILMAGSALETTATPVFGPHAVEDVTLCHEMAHQWMGNCVSVSNWGDDIWWVEGFAQFSEWLEVERTHGRVAYEDVARRCMAKSHRKEAGSSQAT